MLDTLRILYLPSDSSLYGSNRSLLNMLSSLNLEKQNYLVITPYYGEFNKELDKSGIRNIVIKYHWECAPKGNSVYSRLRFIYKYFEKNQVNSKAKKAIIATAKANGINVIHSNSSVISLGFEVAKTLGIRHVWHLREYMKLDHDLTLYKGEKQYFKKIQSSDAVICVSKSLADYYKVNGKARVIYNAVARQSDAMEPGEKENYFLFCGSFFRNKGLHKAIAGFAEVAKLDKNVTLKIAGNISNANESPYYSYIKHLIKELGLGNRVEFLNYVKDVRILMNKAIALLVCSLHEGMGRVTAEAMLYNCLVIGYDDKAGTSELIEHKKTGLLYGTREQLVSHMQYALKEEAEVAQIRKQAQEYALNNFTEEVFRSKMTGVYESLP